MKIAVCFLIFVALFIPLIGASAGVNSGSHNDNIPDTGQPEPGDTPRAGRQSSSAVTLTASQVSSAVDIEAAIIQATAEGTRQGMVTLDGKKGAFVFTGEDRSVNIFVSNLTLRGVNQPVIQNCDDGLFFDNFPLENVQVEGITFLCSGDGVEASGSFQDVTLRNNLFQAANNGIGLGGGSSEWQITGNTIQAGWNAITIHGAKNIMINDNHLAGSIGVALMGCSGSQVRRNAIGGSYQGVLLGQESWQNLVQSNTIIGVSAAGVALEPGSVRNRVLSNSVLCAAGSDCLTVDAQGKGNVIEKNRP